MAGQIPLIPASLTLITPPDFSMAVLLSWQHVRKILKAASEARWTGLMDSAICWLTNVENEMEWKRRIDAVRYVFDPEITLQVNTSTGFWRRLD